MDRIVLDDYDKEKQKERALREKAGAFAGSGEKLGQQWDEKTGSGEKLGMLFASFLPHARCWLGQDLRGRVSSFPGVVEITGK